MEGNFDLVIFGGTGDLALRKLYPALFLADCDDRLHAGGRIIAAARQTLDDEAFRAKVAEALQRFVPKVTGGTPAAQVARGKPRRRPELAGFVEKSTTIFRCQNDMQIPGTPTGGPPAYLSVKGVGYILEDRSSRTPRPPAQG